MDVQSTSVVWHSIFSCINHSRWNSECHRISLLRRKKFRCHRFCLSTEHILQGFGRRCTASVTQCVLVSLYRVGYPDSHWYIWRHGNCSVIYFNTLRPKQNGRHFPDDSSNCIFLNENAWISIEISLKFVPRGPINNIPALVQIMACADQATNHYLNQWWLDYRRIYASLGLNELWKCY